MVLFSGLGDVYKRQGWNAALTNLEKFPEERFLRASNMKRDSVSMPCREKYITPYFELGKTCGRMLSGI